MNAIRERRLELEISQSQLANRAELPSQVISEFELGRRQPWPKARKSIAEVLGMPESILFPSTKVDANGWD